MPQYLSPGVFVEEVPSAVKAIAGVGTSTAGFIGVIPSATTLPSVSDEAVGVGTGAAKSFPLARTPVQTTGAKVRVKGADLAAGFALKNEGGGSYITFDSPPESGAAITVSYTPTVVAAGEVKLCTNFTEFKKFFGDFSTDEQQSYLAHAVYGFFNNGGSRCYVVRLAPLDATPPTTPTTPTTPTPPTTADDAKPADDAKKKPVAANPTVAAKTADAKTPPDIGPALEAFEAIDEIAIVAAPGFTDAASRGKLVAHCAQKTKDRFAILDSPRDVEAGGGLDLTLFNPAKAGTVAPANSNYAAFYFPWIQVFDPAAQAASPGGDGLIFVPPSGHVAGIYARVDAERGVHKAPANEAVLGALGLRYNLSRSQQDGLNPQGINCLRSMNGNIRVWGARTVGGDQNADLKYVNVRRTLLYLRESIDEGTQWVVFEPNTPALWQKITRNVTAFLTNVWRSGALFGNTAAEAFYVKCDAETNPPELRELGQIVTEVGVAIVRPAEFVIFRISQFTAPGS